ncbi:MAG: 4-hydroxy-3-methylbut-2-enyl diphosphate reductase [Verrucomicrobiota bacterium]
MVNRSKLSIKKILLAQPRGFCAGVERAIECIEETLKYRKQPVYCFREIVHNRYVVDQLRQRGVRFVHRISDIPVGAVVIFSAHGVAPDVRKEAENRQLVVIDATCPFVNKVHAEVRNYAENGYAILLIGDRNHDEVIGVAGEAPANIRIVENTAEAEKVNVADADRIAAVTQTTLSVSETSKIMSILRRRFPALVTPADGDICYATQDRQEAVRKMVEFCDLILVLGAVNSSNTNRLVEVARADNGNAALVSNIEDVKNLDFAGVETLGITAGASTPEEFVEETIDYLKNCADLTVENVRGRKEDMHFSLPQGVIPE